MRYKIQIHTHRQLTYFWVTDSGGLLNERLMFLWIYLFFLKLYQLVMLFRHVIWKLIGTWDVLYVCAGNGEKMTGDERGTFVWTAVHVWAVPQVMKLEWVHCLQ